ncbi:MAG: tetratricopeptide repeat protein, partial [Planctomycetia bacterium]
MWFDADQRLRKAVERFEEGDVEAARAMLRSLDRKGVVSPRIDLYLGHCHLEADRPEAALARYRKAAALSPEAAAPWVGLGLAHGRLGQLERAIVALGRALALDPACEEAHCHLAHCHALLGQLDEARTHAAAARRLDPTCVHALRHLALATWVAGRARESLALWAEVERAEPAHPELDLGRARCLEVLHRREEARACYLRALAGPLRADAAFGLAQLERGQGRLPEALARLRLALEADPGHLEARLCEVRTLLELGDAAGAWERLLPVVQGHPRDADVVGAAAPVLRALGKPGDARALLEALVESEPGDARAWLHLGEHRLAEGDGAGSVAALRRAWRAGPDQEDAPRLLARALARQGRARDAVRVLATACMHQPHAPQLALDLAAAQCARGRPEAAERGLVRALAAHPDSPDLWAAAAELALDAGRGGVARTRLRGALRRAPRHPHALALLVRWLLRAGRARQAVAAGRVAVGAAAPGDEVVRDLAEASLACGQVQEAVLLLRRYVLASPSDGLGYGLLAAALRAGGDEAGARVQ